VGQPSESLRVDIPGDIPTVTNVFGTGNTIQVQWSEQVLQTGPAANYTVYNVTNSILVATGTATAPPTGSVNPTGTVTVTLNAPLTTGTQYVLRVAAVTVHDLQNNPNGAEFVPFTAAPSTGNIQIQTGPCAGGTSPATEGTIQTDNTPTFTGAAQALTPGSTVSNVSVNNGALDPGTNFGPTNATITLGAGTANVSFSFTTPALGQGTQFARFTVNDTQGGSAVFTCTFTVDTVAPVVDITAPITAAPATVTDDDIFGVNVSFTSSEAGTYVIEGRRAGVGAYQTLGQWGFIFCIGASPATGPASAGTNTLNVCLPDLFNRDYAMDLRVRVTDAAGLVGEDIETSSINVNDNDAPVIVDLDRFDNDTITVDFDEPANIDIPANFQLRDSTCGVTLGTGTAVVAGNGTNNVRLDLAMQPAQTVTAGVSYCLVVTAANSYSDIDTLNNFGPAGNFGPFVA
jgi:hypothetical protein